MTFMLHLGEQAQAAGDDVRQALTSLEVEENADLPGAIQLTMPIASQSPAGSKDLTEVGEDRWKPYARLAVTAWPDGKPASCIFDGYVLAHRIHVDRGATAATLQVWGQDVSCLMNLKEAVKSWEQQSDSRVADAIFQKYGFSSQSPDDGDPPPPSGQTLMQRATDAQFLRDRARRGGKLFRVACTDRPGQNTGYFIKPDLGTSPAFDLTLIPQAQETSTIEALDFAWDVARPTKVHAQVLLDTKQPVPQSDATTDSGLSLLAGRSLADFTDSDQPLGPLPDRFMEPRLTTTASSAGDLNQRVRSLLREAQWFVKCEGEVDLARLNGVMRAATVVQIKGAGSLHSGKYFVWSVRHTITPLSHRMRFVLVRNSVDGRQA